VRPNERFASVSSAFYPTFAKNIAGKIGHEHTAKHRSGQVGQYSQFVRTKVVSFTSKEAMSKDDSPTYDPLLTRRELANRWKVSVETLKRRERARILRPIRLDGRVVRYRMSDVVKIEQEGYGE
jgi:hypothetical protein